MAFAVGHISGGHFNPAVTIGLWLGKRFAAKDVGPYIVAQLVGAVLAGGVLLVIASGVDGFDASTGQARELRHQRLRRLLARRLLAARLPRSARS